MYGSTGDCRAPRGGAAQLASPFPCPAGANIKVLRWDYASGCDIATHFLGGVHGNRSGNQGAVILGFHSLRPKRRSHREELGRDQNAGHRIAPHIAIDALTLPEERLLKMSDLQFQKFSTQPGRSLFRNPLYHGPWINLLVCEMISVAVGTARGALDLYEQDLREKKLPVAAVLVSL